MKRLEIENVVIGGACSDLTILKLTAISFGAAIGTLQFGVGLPVLYVSVGALYACAI